MHFARERVLVLLLVGVGGTNCTIHLNEHLAEDTRYTPGQLGASRNYRQRGRHDTPMCACVCDWAAICTRQLASSVFRVFA